VSNFAPDGRIVVATFAGHAFRWEPTTAHALDFACRVTGRCLSRAEWSSVFPSQPWRETCPATSR
jgi:hypothetical protein